MAVVIKCLPIAWSLTTIVQTMSVSIFEKIPLVKLFSQSDDKHIVPASPKQLYFVRLILRHDWLASFNPKRVELCVSQLKANSHMLASRPLDRQIFVPTYTDGHATVGKRYCVGQ